MVGQVLLVGNDKVGVKEAVEQVLPVGVDSVGVKEGEVITGIMHPFFPHPLLPELLQYRGKRDLVARLEEKKWLAVERCPVDSLNG